MNQKINTCYACRYAFGWFDQDCNKSVLMCRPGDDHNEKIAEIVCVKFQRAPGADEPE
jgi:hypothetical protein